MAPVMLLLVAVVIALSYLVIDASAKLEQQALEIEKLRLWSVQANDVMIKKHKFDAYYVLNLQSRILQLSEEKAQRDLTTEESETLDTYKKKLLRILTKDQ